MINICRLHLQPFMNSHFHFLIIVEMVTSCVLPQWSKQSVGQSVTSSLNKCNNHFTALCGLAVLS
jgi:hypothetical protein